MFSSFSFPRLPPRPAPASSSSSPSPSLLSSQSKSKQDQSFSPAFLTSFSGSVHDCSSSPLFLNASSNSAHPFTSFSRPHSPIFQASYLDDDDVEDESKEEDSKSIHTVPFQSQIHLDHVHTDHDDDMQESATVPQTSSLSLVDLLSSFEATATVSSSTSTHSFLPQLMAGAASSTSPQARKRSDSRFTAPASTPAMCDEDDDEEGMSANGTQQSERTGSRFSFRLIVFHFYSPE